MRVATAHSYDSTISNLNKRQAELSDLQERISTGKRVLRASDDPVAAVLAESAQNKLSRVAADQRALEAGAYRQVTGKLQFIPAGVTAGTDQHQKKKAPPGSHALLQIKTAP